MLEWARNPVFLALLEEIVEYTVVDQARNLEYPALLEETVEYTVHIPGCLVFAEDRPGWPAAAGSADMSVYRPLDHTALRIAMIRSFVRLAVHADSAACMDFVVDGETVAVLVVCHKY